MAPSNQYTGLNNVQVRNFDHRNKWCKYITAQISVGNDQQAGRMEAYRVDRAVLYNSKAYFHHFMNKPNKMLRDLALHLFDRHGHLESHLCGLFGAETDSGGLILIRCDSVKPHQAQDKAMSQGVQQLLVKLQHQTNNETSWTLAVMRNEGLQPMGFRPIERSEYLACCALERHPCWQVPKATDKATVQEEEAEPATAPAVQHISRLEQQPASRESADEQPETYSSNSRLNQQLADAVRGADYHEDESGLSFGGQAPADIGTARSLIDAGADINKCNAVHCAVAADQKQSLCYLLGKGGNVNERDLKGSTPLHIAAYEGKLECAKLLISLGADATIKDNQGYTPLDVCTLRIKSLRDIEGITGTFTQHKADFMTLTECLQRAGALQNTTAAASLPYYQSKHGCTCGECKSGFMSPRMIDRLLWTAEEAVAMVADSIDDCIPAWPCNMTALQDAVTLYLFHHVPVALRSQVSEEFAEGWLAVIDTFTNLLQAGYVPTASAITAVTRKKPGDYCLNPKAARYFLKHGGRVEFAIDAILSHSREEHEVIGNGGMLENVDFLAKHAELPACENDTDYNMVKVLLCNQYIVPDGPYDTPLEDGSMSNTDCSEYTDNEHDGGTGDDSGDD